MCIAGYCLHFWFKEDVVGIEKVLVHNNPARLNICRISLVSAFRKHLGCIPPGTVRLKEQLGRQRGRLLSHCRLS